MPSDQATRGKRHSVFDLLPQPTVPYGPPGTAPNDQTPFPPQEGLLDALRDTIGQSSESVVPLSSTQARVCPRCGQSLRTSAESGWCIQCGYTASLHSMIIPPPAPPKTKVPLWPAFLALGAGAIIGATAYRGLFVPEASVLGIWWILIEAAVGLGAYILAHLWVVVLTVRHWRDYDGFKFIDPTYVWKCAVEHLPRTRWAICLAVWGAIAFGYAFVLCWQNDFAIKDRTKKTHAAAVQPKIRVADEADASEVGSASSDLPESSGSSQEEARKHATIDLFGEKKDVKVPTHVSDCVVIGYVPDPADPGRIEQLVLGTRGSDGNIRYAGTVNQFAKSDQVGQWVDQVKSLKPLLDTPTYMPSGITAVPVDPSLACQIGYSEKSAQGVLKGTVVKGVGAKAAGK
jgi:hypothetical protein